MCRERFDRPVGHHAVERVLDRASLPILLSRRFRRSREIADPIERRRAIVTLDLDGGSAKAIAGSLEISRPTVDDVLRRWAEEGWPGLADRARAPRQPARKVDLRAMVAIRRLQANPELGAFRILALHRALGAPVPTASIPHEPRAMPLAAQRRHQFWSVDSRSVEDHALGTGKPASVISIIERHAVLARFFDDDHQPPQFAHQERPLDRQRPAAVLGWGQGAWCAAADRDRLFRLRARRGLNAAGLRRFRHWRLDAERGWAGERAAVWVHGETRTVEHATETGAQDRVALDSEGHGLREVTAPRFFAADHGSPPPCLAPVEETAWHPARRLAPDRPRRRRDEDNAHAPLFTPATERVRG